MIRGGFLDPNIRADLIALVRDGKAETRLTRRANALLLLDDGMSCEAIAKVLYLDDDTIRYWYQLYGEKGLIWLADFGYQGRACQLMAAQQDGLKDWVAQTLPRTSTTVGEWIEKSYVVTMDSATVGIPRNSPDGSYEKVYLDVRISYGGAFVHSALKIDIEPANFFFGPFSFGDIVRDNLGGGLSLKSERRGGDFHVNWSPVQS